ncbi:MAG: hypothetical protein DRP56_07140 [Planctomycetota bacterium]|nr:MAG: hypothetical protein DRP56_07140 [Planctomycetota bacterium]
MSQILGIRPTKICYILRARDIVPLGRAGNIRLYDAAAVDQVREELKTDRRFANGRRREVAHAD